MLGVVADAGLEVDGLAGLEPVGQVVDQGPERRVGVAGGRRLGPAAGRGDHGRPSWSPSSSRSSSPRSRLRARTSRARTAPSLITQDRADLGRGHPLEVAHHQDLAVAGVEPGQGGVDPVEQLLADQGAAGGRAVRRQAGRRQECAEASAIGGSAGTSRSTLRRWATTWWR